MVSWKVFSHSPRSSPKFHVVECSSSRFAAKEAAIKAHQTRRLFLRQVSVLPPPLNFDAFHPIAGWATTKPLAIIEPPVGVVLMNEATAFKRGLFGFHTEAMGIINKKEVSPIPTSKYSALHASHPELQGGLWERKRRALLGECRFADVSISHEGDYAVAICQALDEHLDLEKDFVVDWGDGPPIHEPEHGDRDFDGFDVATWNDSCD